MRYLLLLAGITILFSVSVLSAKDAVDFSGGWTLNESASDQGGGGGGGRGMGPSKLSVKQDGDKLMVESTRRNRNGDELKMVSNYTLDGKECKNDSENRTSVSTAVWSEDGATLTITTKTTMSRNGQEFTFDSVETWSLKDGKLIVDAKISSQQGERESRRVYDKV